MFDAISLQAPDPLLLVDTLGTLRDANHAAARAFGHSRDVLRGMTLAALGDPRADGRFTARYCRADGTPFACEVSAGRVNEAGDVLCILRTLPRIGEDLYTQIVRKCPIFISVVRLSDNAYIDVSDAYLASTGLTREEIAGKTFLELGIQLSMDDILKVARAVVNEDPTPIEIQTIGPRGKVTDAIQCHQFVDLDGTRCVVAYAIDITAQKRLEAEYRHAQKMEAVGRLAGGVAHDFNNILTAILGHAELLLLNLDEATPMRRHADQLRKAALRASSLTGQLLALSRKQVMQPRVVDVNALVGNLSAMLQRIIGEDIELITEPTVDPVCVKADLGQLEQVVLNLAVNARDAMVGGGRLTLRTASVDDQVRLDVCDTGTGMDDQVRAHLFEPFFTTKADGRGTGLGLSTAYGIVTQSGGRIEVETAPGAGSTFHIFLPRVDELPGTEIRPVTREAKKGSESILLVEDDPDVRTFVRDVLETHGYCVMVAHDGQAALRLASENANPIHLLVTDVIMPHMSGPELAGRLKVLRPELRTLFITGYPGDTLLQKGGIPPSTRVVQKPFSVTQLAQSVRETLDG